jgi:hypothetical protein
MAALIAELLLHAMLCCLLRLEIKELAEWREHEAKKQIKRRTTRSKGNSTTAAEE